MTTNQSPTIAELEASVARLVEALEPFAAMARVMENAMQMTGGKATPQTVVASASWEGGLGVITYGHFLDARAAFPGTPRGWGGMYTGPSRARQAIADQQGHGQ